jgi:hypothetical protein
MNGPRSLAISPIVFSLAGPASLSSLLAPELDVNPTLRVCDLVAILVERGYQPLAALDDDGNGWLSDRELSGIGVWRDKNQDGVADPGEVIAATALRASEELPYDRTGR